MSSAKKGEKRKNTQVVSVRRVWVCGRISEADYYFLPSGKHLQYATKAKQRQTIMTLYR